MILKWVTAGICSYESCAIITGRVPTITALTRRHRWLGPVIVGTLTVHFYNADKR